MPGATYYSLRSPLHSRKRVPLLSAALDAALNVGRKCNKRGGDHGGRWDERQTNEGKNELKTFVSGTSRHVRVTFGARPAGSTGGGEGSEEREGVLERDKDKRGTDRQKIYCLSETNSCTTLVSANREREKSRPTVHQVHMFVTQRGQ